MTQTLEGLSWALPEGLEASADKLAYRLDIYSEAILLHHYGDNTVETRLVSVRDIARAFTQHLRLSSGILPGGALWWGTGPEGEQVALWRPPQVWQVALMVEAFQPPRRFRLPMPGLVFVCSPGRPPRVYAAKSRPRSLDWPVCHVPLFNLFQDGRSCAGTHKFPERVEEIPESFFTSFFTREGDFKGRSKKHPDDLLALWEELDGRKHYPSGDLVPLGTVREVLEGKDGRR